MTRPTLRVLYGPPGTGKTWRAKRDAVAIIDGSVNPATVDERHDQLVEQGRIWWVSFHPSYSYEDFVEGFRPLADQTGALRYEVLDGPLKLACKACGAVGLASLKVGDRIGERDRYEVVEIGPTGAVLRSQVTRTDTVVDTIDQYADLWTINRLRERGLGPEWLAIPGTDNERKQEFARRSGLPTTVQANPGPLRALYQFIEEAGPRSEMPVVLVIDEINRADLSRVFGELITLVEVDKRRGAAEERRVFLPYSKTLFSVPMGLSIVATMNTADRSLQVFDIALRRRFEFVEVGPDPVLCPADHGGVNVRALLSIWNRRLETLLSKDLAIGHSELMSDRLDQTRLDRKWPDDEVGKLRALAAVIREKIAPLLLEYFHDDWRKAEIVLGNKGLIERADPGDVVALAEGIIAIEEGTSYRLSSWWDSDSADFDPQRFKTALIAGG